MSYYAVLCNPKVYRIQDAVADLDEDTWNLPKGDVNPGDHIVFWKTLAGEEHRGVVALGEVTASPEVIPFEPLSAPFWRNQPSAEPRRRFRVRYINPPKAPLWLDNDTSGLLAELTVSRGQGTKLFHVTEDQWERLLVLLGGCPSDDVVAVEEVSATAAQDALEARFARSKGQGYVSSPERRRAIELRAMEAAQEYLKGLGYQWEDTSANKPYDLRAQRDDESPIYIEVKGTTTLGEQVHLTRNEVEHARKHRGQMVLFILHDIDVEDVDGKPVASGGKMRVLWPWDVGHGKLRVVSYTYQVPRGEG